MRNKIITKLECSVYPTIYGLKIGEMFVFKQGTGEVYMKIEPVNGKQAIVQLSTGSIFYPTPNKEVVHHRVPVTIIPPEEA